MEIHTVGVRDVSRFLAPTILLTAGATKLVDHSAYQASASRMALVTIPGADLFPAPLLEGALAALPLAEISLALLLFGSSGRLFRFGAYSSLILAVVFASSRAAFHVRGISPTCQCFGALTDSNFAGVVASGLTIVLVLTSALLAYRGDPLEGSDCSE